MCPKDSKNAAGQQAGIFIPNNFSLLTIQALPTFRGKDSNISVEEFLERIEDCALQWGWADTEKYFALKDRLFGEARECIREFGDEIKDLASLKSRLLNLYGKKVSPSTALFNFMSFKQPADLAVERYIAQAIQMSKLLDFGECDEATKSSQRKNMLLSMLKTNTHPNFLRGILAQNPQNLDDFKKFALLEESAWLAVRGQNNPFLQTPSEIFSIQQQNNQDTNNLAAVCANLVSQVERLTLKIENLERGREYNQPRRGRRGGPGPCYVCQRMGHIARSCPDRQNNAVGYQPAANQGGNVNLNQEN